MSGIYITGMEMPKSCFYCPMRMKVDPDTIKCLATGEKFEETFAGTIEMRNRGKCPLILVPDHGRLIDADALHYTRVAIWHSDKTMPMGGYVGGMNGVVMSSEIKDAPTIIPGEEVDK